MSVLIKGIDIPKKHHMNCYYIDDDGKVFDVSRKNVVGKAVQISSIEPKIIRCKDCKHYYYADNRIPQEQRYSCGLDGDRWKPDSFCSYAERKEE